VSDHIWHHSSLGATGAAAGGAPPGVSTITKMSNHVFCVTICPTNWLMAVMRSALVAMLGTEGAVTSGGNAGGNGGKFDPLAHLCGNGDHDLLWGGGGLDGSQTPANSVGRERPLLGSLTKLLLRSSLTSLSEVCGVDTSGISLKTDGGDVGD
jgi:hypothetical protein